MTPDERAEDRGRDGRDDEGLRLTWTQLDRLLAYVDEMIICIDNDATVSFASAATARLTGHEPSSVVGRSIAEYVHPDDLVDLLRVMDRWQDRQGSGVVDPARIRAASGDWIPMTIDGVTGVDLGPLGTVIATLRPVDATSEIEQELRQRLVAESRLVRIASTFVHTPAERLDDNVDDALAELGSMGAVDRVEIVLFDAVAPDDVEHPRVGRARRARAARSHGVIHTRGQPDAATDPGAPRGEHPVGGRPRAGLGAGEGVVRAAGRALDAGRPAGRPGSRHRHARLRGGARRLDLLGRAPPHAAHRGRHPRPGLRQARRRGAARLPGPPRPADRVAQPMGVPRSAAAGGAPAPLLARRRRPERVGGGRPAVRPRPVQGGQRLARPPTRRRAARRGGPTGAARPARRARCWPGWAATSW